MFSAEIRDSALSRRNAVLDGAAEHNRTLNIDVIKSPRIHDVHDVHDGVLLMSGAAVMLPLFCTLTTSTNASRCSPSGGCSCRCAASSRSR